MARYITGSTTPTVSKTMMITGELFEFAKTQLHTEAQAAEIEESAAKNMI